jgi:hypothetical protein
MEKMTEHEKLEYIHSTLQDVANCIEWGKLNLRHRPYECDDLDEDMINQSLTMVEDIREKHFDKDGKLIK